MINWKITKEETLTITMIVDRMAERQAKAGVHPWQRLNPIRLHMDLTACHANGCPLDLTGLLEASDEDFSHDIHGITQHIDRNDAHLRDCFTPRYAVQKAVVA